MKNKALILPAKTVYLTIFMTFMIVLYKHTTVFWVFFFSLCDRSTPCNLVSSKISRCRFVDMNY